MIEVFWFPHTHRDHGATVILQRAFLTERKSRHQRSRVIDSAVGSLALSAVAWDEQKLTSILACCQLVLDPSGKRVKRAWQVTSSKEHLAYCLSFPEGQFWQTQINYVLMSSWEVEIAPIHLGQWWIQVRRDFMSHQEEGRAEVRAVLDCGGHETLCRQSRQRTLLGSSAMFPALLFRPSVCSRRHHFLKDQVQKRLPPRSWSLGKWPLLFTACD